MPRRINITRPATLPAINGVLRALGYAPEQLELVRGDGYYYVTGEDTDILLYGSGEQGLYAMGAHLVGRTVADWVEAVLRHLAQVEDTYGEHFDAVARLATARGAWASWKREAHAVATPER